MEDKTAADAATDSLVSRMAAVLAAQIEAALSKRDAVIESLQVPLLVSLYPILSINYLN